MRGYVRSEERLNIKVRRVTRWLQCQYCSVMYVLQYVMGEVDLRHHERVSGVPSRVESR